MDNNDNHMFRVFFTGLSTNLKAEELMPGKRSVRKGRGHRCLHLLLDVHKSIVTALGVYHTLPLGSSEQMDSKSRSNKKKRETFEY